MLYISTIHWFINVTDCEKNQYLFQLYFYLCRTLVVGGFVFVNEIVQLNHYLGDFGNKKIKITEVSQNRREVDV